MHLDNMHDKFFLNINDYDLNLFEILSKAQF